MTVIKHRAEIDGLRAFAVLPVILFHMDLTWIDGGFIGVDVFFVISGFLITSIVKSDLEAGVFSFRAFWARRVRRILPAMTAVTAVSLPVAYLSTFRPGLDPILWTPDSP
jgi:peptidoglycan/LPS O-acetylase OafA/YrhL